MKSETRSLRPFEVWELAYRPRPDATVRVGRKEVSFDRDVARELVAKARIDPAYRSSHHVQAMADAIERLL